MLAFNGLLERMRDRQVLWCTATGWRLMKGNCNVSHSLWIRFYSVFQPCHSLSVVICINTQIKTRTTSEVTSLGLVVALKPLQSLKTTVSRLWRLRSHPIRENVKRSSFLINKSTNAYHKHSHGEYILAFSLFLSLFFFILPLSLCLHPGSTLKWTIETCIHTNSWEHSVCQSAGLSYLVFDAQLANSPLGPFRMGAQGRPCALSADVFQALYLIVSGCISVTWCSYKTLCLSIGRESYLYLSVGSLLPHLAPERGGLGKRVGRGGGC